MAGLTIDLKKTPATSHSHIIKEGEQVVVHNRSFTFLLKKGAKMKRSPLFKNHWVSQDKASECASR